MDFGIFQADRLTDLIDMDISPRTDSDQLVILFSLHTY